MDIMYNIMVDVHLWVNKKVTKEENIMNDNLIKLSDAAKIIGRTPQTIKHWYKWVEQVGQQNIPATLPKRERIGSRGDMYFKKEDINMLATFRDYLALNPGIMRDYNWTRQGEQGRLRYERREFKNFLKNVE